MIRPRIPVYSSTTDWPRKVAERINTLLTQVEQLISIAGQAAAASINYLQLSGVADATGFDGLFLSGDAQVSGGDFLLHA